MGKIVHTKGNFGSKGVAQGAVCRTCPGSCWTECMRAGVSTGNKASDLRDEGSGFSISFNSFSDDLSKDITEKIPNGISGENAESKKPGKTEEK